MAKVLSSISGNLISAASAGYAPTNSADVSAIASGYQVVSSTATQLYAGTAFLTGVNGDPISASRAGNAANASMANSAYYDGTGRLISALPDSAAVSSIASAYAESAVSGKLDSTAFSTVSGDFLTAETVSSIVTAQYGPQPTDVGVTSINGFGLVAKSADTAYSAIWASIAGTDGNLRALTSLADSAAVSAIASSYAESVASGKADSSSLSSYALSSDVSGVIDTVSTNSASWGAGASLPITGSAGDDTASYEAGRLEYTRYDTAGEPDIRTAILSPDQFYIDYTLDGIDHTSMMLTESMLDFGDSEGDHIVDAYSIDTWNSAVDTVANNSASWGGAVDSATVSSIASSYAESAVSSKLDTTAQVVSATAGDGTYITSINGMGISGQGGGGAAFPAEINYGGNVRAVVTTGFQDATATRPTLFISSNPAYNSYPRMMLSENHATTGKSGAFLADAFEFYSGTGTKVFRADPNGISSLQFAHTPNFVFGSGWVMDTGKASGGNSNNKWIIDSNHISGIAGTARWEYGTSEYNKLTSVHDTVSANSASWGGGGGASLPITGSAGDDTATYGVTGIEFTRNDTAGEPDIRTATLSPDQFYIDYTLDGIDHTSMMLTESMLDFGDSDGDHIVDAYSIDSWNSAVDTVSSNSASWGGGVDSATVSAIASAYQVVSSVGANGSYATTINNMYISAINAFKAEYANKVNTGTGDNDTAYISSLGGIDSATCSAIASSYAESAVSSKQDSSAMSAYALSSNVSGVIDTVSTNSASWGAGATLPIIGSAGTDSATYGETSVEFYRYDTAGEPDIRTATLSPDALDITYTVDENDYYSVHINENGVEFSDPDGYYSVTPYDITNWNSAVDTVANNSASWGQGGVDSATVSSIASSYAESAASSKLDTSAQVITSTGSASALSGIWPVITAYFVSSINGSALLPYGYSALSANSANWNSTRISVFNNSANWNSAYSLISGVTALMDAI